MIDPSGEAKGPKEFLTGSFLAFPPSLLDRSDYENGNKGTPLLFAVFLLPLNLSSIFSRTAAKRLGRDKGHERPPASVSTQER